MRQVRDETLEAYSQYLQGRITLKEFSSAPTSNGVVVKDGGRTAMTNDLLLEVVRFYGEHLKDILGVGEPQRWVYEVDGGLVVPFKDEQLRHLRWMSGTILAMVASGEMSEGKAFRWLGFMQGVLWSQGVFSLEQLKEHNRSPETDPPLHDPATEVRIGDYIVPSDHPAAPKADRRLQANRAHELTEQWANGGIDSIDLVSQLRDVLDSKVPR